MTHTQPRRRQPDLFAVDDPPVTLACAELRRLVPLVSALLMESVVDRPATEDEHEDHA